MLLDLTIVFVPIAGFAVLFVLLGMAAFGAMFPPARMPATLRFGVSYFLGLSLFVVVFKLLNACLPAHSRALLVLCCAACAAVIALRAKALRAQLRPIVSRISPASVAVVVVLVAAVFGFVLFTWLIPNVTPTWAKMYRHIGTGHPGRYANMAISFVNANHVSNVPQHFGEAIVASLTMFAGEQRVFVILYVWHCISMCALITCVYGLLGFLGLGRLRSAAGAAVVMAGNTALSVLHVTSIDSVSPFIANGIADNTVQIGLVLATVLWLIEVWREGGPILRYAALPVICTIYCCFAAEQYVLLVVPATLGVLAGACRRRIVRTRDAVILAALLAAAVIVGIHQGGSLAPKSLFRQTETIPGATSVEHGAFRIHPFLPHQHAAGDLLAGKTWHDFGFDRDMLDVESLGQLDQCEAIWTVESRIWTSLRVVFWPLAGLILLSVRASARRGGPTGYIHYRILCTVGAVALVGGYLMAFFLVIGGHEKWVMARFMIPGYALGMISLPLAAGLYLQRVRSRRIRAAVWVLLVAVTTIGPLLDYSSIVNNNIFADGAFEMFMQKHAAFIH